MDSSYNGSFGPLYRIPNGGGAEGSFLYVDVTKKDAKRAAKRLEKQARLIRKALA